MKLHIFILEIKYGLTLAKDEFVILRVSEDNHNDPNK